MNSSSSAVSIELLKRLEPLASLTQEQLEYLAAKAAMEHVAAGEVLFREGETDRKMVYLLRGEVRLESSQTGGQQRVQGLVAAAGESCAPLDREQPRRSTAIAVTDVDVIRLESGLVESMLAWSQFASREPEIIMSAEGVLNVDKARWIAKISRAPIFKYLHPANIEKFLDQLEPVRVNAGDVIIRQGDVGDYCYFIDEGMALVTCVKDDESETIELAELVEGDGFGEMALISGQPRNATVSMTTDGVLLRLSKADFVQLLKEPPLQWVTYEQVRALIAKGAQWLDVRTASEFAHAHLPGAVNIPGQDLHRRMRELDRTSVYICYCDTGRRSSAVVSILGQYGIRAHVLQGGVNGVPRDGLDAATGA